MEAHRRTFWCIILILILVVETKQSDEKDTTTETRRGRVNGRIVKLYSGIKNDPVLCPKEGFLKDPVDCTVFYRCLKANNGKYTVFRFQCGPGTIYDPETEICNHPQNTKRSDCGGSNNIMENNKMNEVEGFRYEMPHPLSTAKPSSIVPTTSKSDTFASFYSKTNVTTNVFENFTVHPTTQKPINRLEDITLTQTYPNIVSQPFTSNPFNYFKNVTQTSTPITNETIKATAAPLYYSKTTNQNKVDFKETTTRFNEKSLEICTVEGFIGDSLNCRKFYRCVNNLRGGFIRYEFLCNELTIWDDETHSCNHPWATRNSRCGRDIFNDISATNSSNEVNFNENENNFIHTSKPGYGIHAINKLTEHQQQFSYGEKLNNIQTSPSFQTHSSGFPTSQTQVQPINDLINKKPITNSNSNISDYTINKINDSTIKKTDFVQYILEKPTSGYEADINNEGLQDQQKFSYGDKLNNIQTSTVLHTPSSISPISQTQDSANYFSYGMPIQNNNFSSSHQTLYNNNNSTLRPPALPYGEKNYPSTKKDKNHLCYESGFIGDVKDCKKFYRCVDNGQGSFTKYEFICGQGTIWDPTLQACNYEWAVKECGAKRYANDVTKDIVSSTPNQTSSPIASQDSSYSNYVGNTDYSTIKYKTTQLIPQGDSESKCTVSGFFGIENNCQIFYRCVSNKNGEFTKFFYKCDEGHLWDSKLKACNRAELVKSCGPPSKNIINDIKLSSTTPLVLTTTNHNTKKENFDEVGYPQSSTEANQRVTESSKLQNRNNECKIAGFMGDANDCQKFYRCVDSGNNGYIKYEFTCSQGTVWDSSIEACNHAWAVKTCGGSELNTPITSTKKPYYEDNSAHYSSINSETSVISSTTKEIPSTSRYPSYYEDNSGYLSSNNIETSVVSSTANDFTTMKSPTTTLINYKNKCHKLGFVGDNEDCTKFYRCVDDGNGGFIQYQFSCGQGTVWDAKIDACNHKWAVEECGINNDVLKENEPTTGNIMITSSDSEINIFTQYPINHKITTPIYETFTSNANVVCNKDGFMGDNNNCKKFYRCVSNGNGSYTRYEFLCGEGTMWDQEIEACNYESNNRNCKIKNNMTSVESNVIITSSTVSFIEESSSKSPTGASVPVLLGPETVSETHESENQIINENYCSSEGFYADLNNCKNFYRCVDDGKGHYTKYKFSCGEGTAWDNSIQSCNHIDKVVSCQYNQTSNPENSPLVEPPIYDEQPSIQPSEESSTIKTTTLATTNSFTSTIQHTHDNTRTTTKAPQQSSTTNYQNVCRKEGYFGNEENCKKFYRCVSNEKDGYTKYDFDCGDGTVWDQDIIACNHPQDVTNFSCNKNIVNESSTSGDNNDYDNQPTSSTLSHDQSNEDIATTAPQQKPSTQTIDNRDICENEGFFGNKKDCKKFYRCVNNPKGSFTKYDFDCGDGTIWDQDITACNHPQDVANPSCNNTSSDAHESSSVAQTTSSHSSSTPPTISSSNNSSTNTESTVTSTTSQISTTTSDMIPNNNNYTCTKAGFFSDPNDCKKFYRCVDWDNNGERFSIFHFECGDGTIWDPALETCNHEESVYPPRKCNVQQESNNTTQTSETQAPENPAETTTQHLTTQEITTEKSTTTTTKKTTTKPTTEQSTTVQSSTLQSTTPQETTSEMTTKTSTTDQSTTTQTTTTLPQQTTTEASSTSEKSTTISQQSTSESTTITEKPTTSQQTTTETSTTTEKSTTSLQTTTEQTSPTTNEQTTEQSSTTEDSSTTEKSTTQSMITEEQTTTSQISTTTENNQESSTSTSSSNDCPETNEGEYLYVCPTSFRRHPKYCNIFYQCTEDNDSRELKIATFQCPNNTIYDEKKTQCVEEKKADKKCNGEIASKYRVKRLNPYFKEPIIVTKEKLGCSSNGHFIFEKNQECSQAFLKCKSTATGFLQGLVFRCPEGFTYWSISRRCEAIQNVIDCKHSQLDWSERHEIPIEIMNVGPKNLL